VLKNEIQPTLGRRQRAGDVLRASLVSDLRRGELKPGDMIPGQVELAAKFQIGEITVRRALKELQEEGFVRRERGRGTIITEWASRLVRSSIGTGQVLLALQTHGHTFAPLFQRFIQTMNQRALLPTVVGLDEDDGKLLSAKRMAPLLKDAFRLNYEGAVFEWTGNGKSESLEALLSASRTLSERGTPVMWLLAAPEELPPALDADLVTIDYRGGAARATRHLLDQGYERVAFLAPHQSPDFSANHPYIRLFEDGYRSTMESAGLGDRARIIETPPADQHQVMAEDILREPDRPEAIVGCQDFALTAYCDAACRLGLRVPDDLGLVGFGNTPWATQYDLSSMDLNLDLLVKHVSQWLDDAGERGTTHATTLIQPRLVLRGSSSPANETRTVS